jgi:hypothetical protein
MKHLIRHIILLCGLPLLLAGCMKWDYGDAVEDFNATGAGLFITNEGNFQYGNATLSYYDPATQQVQNEVFFRANGMKLGDVAQSMCIHDNKGWVVVNNSHVIFAIDLNTFKEVGRIDEPDLAALHPFPQRRESLRHPIVGQPHLHHQPEEI